MSTTTVNTTERSGGSVGASAGTPAAVTTDPVTHRSQTLAERGLMSHDTSQRQRSALAAASSHRQTCTRLKRILFVFD